MGRTPQEMEEILQQIQAGVARIERDHGARFDALEGKIDAVHADLVRIENDHGAKIEALFDGFDGVNGRLDRLEAGQAAMRAELGRINGTLGLLRPIASDHESRIQALESALKVHPAKQD